MESQNHTYFIKNNSVYFHTFNSCKVKNPKPDWLLTSQSNKTPMLVSCSPWCPFKAVVPAIKVYIQLPIICSLPDRCGHQERHYQLREFYWTIRTYFHHLTSTSLVFSQLYRPRLKTGCEIMKLQSTFLFHLYPRLSSFREQLSLCAQMYLLFKVSLRN